MTIDSLEFCHPVFVGDVRTVTAEIIGLGDTSIEVRVRADPALLAFRTQPDLLAHNLL